MSILEVRAVLEGIISTVDESHNMETTLDKLKSVAAGLRVEYLGEIKRLDDELKELKDSRS